MECMVHGYIRRSSHAPVQPRLQGEGQCHTRLQTQPLEQFTIPYSESLSSFRRKPESRRPAAGQALRLRSATLRANVRPFVLSVARKGGVEAWMPDQVRHDGSVTAWLQLNVKRSRE